MQFLFRSSQIFAFVFLVGIHTQATDILENQNNSNKPLEALDKTQSLCTSQLKKPQCPSKNSNELKDQAGELKKVACEGQMAALECSQFFAKFPDLKQNANTCTIEESCQIGNDLHLLGGCESYGIHLKDDFSNALTEKMKCLKDTKCFWYSKISNLLYPSLYVLLAIKNPQRNFLNNEYQKIKADLAKFNKMNCLNASIRAEMQCYLLVKYGSAMVSGASLVGKSLISRMASLEADLVAGGTSKSFSKITENFQTSGKIKFIRGGKILPVEEGLVKNKSYTVLVEDGVVYIGDDYVGKNGSTAGSHIPLHRDIDQIKNFGQQSKNFEATAYMNKGGSIKVRSDGSIDVSGYHIGRKSPIAADEITRILKEADPDLVVRSTPGRLSDIQD